MYGVSVQQNLLCRSKNSLHSKNAALKFDTFCSQLQMFLVRKLFNDLMSPKRWKFVQLETSFPVLI